MPSRGSCRSCSLLTLKPILGCSYVPAGRTERTGGGYSDAVTYAERLRPPILWWVVVAVLASTFVIAVAVFLPGEIVLVSLAVAVAIVIGLMLAFTATVRVTPAGFAGARGGRWCCRESDGRPSSWRAK